MTDNMPRQGRPAWGCLRPTAAEATAAPAQDDAAGGTSACTRARTREAGRLFCPKECASRPPKRRAAAGPRRRPQVRQRQEPSSLAGGDRKSVGPCPRAPPAAAGSAGSSAKGATGRSAQAESPGARQGDGLEPPSLEPSSFARGPLFIRCCRREAGRRLSRVQPGDALGFGVGARRGGGGRGGAGGSLLSLLVLEQNVVLGLRVASRNSGPQSGTVEPRRAMAPASCCERSGARLARGPGPGRRPPAAASRPLGFENAANFGTLRAVRAPRSPAHVTGGIERDSP